MRYSIFFLLLIFGLLPLSGISQHSVDSYGAIVRGDTTRKEIALVFTGDVFGEGGRVILKVLASHSTKASFFLTGNFYSNKNFRSLIHSLKKDGHYLGAHSDKHLLYAPWSNRDSLLITRQQFDDDLLSNYNRMQKFKIEKDQALWFLPPYEWYNAEIVKWTKASGLKLINFTPGTRSTADYAYPEMGKSYRSSEEIYQSIVRYEKSSRNGLNGFILLLHVGTDPRRTDKFYERLDELLTELEKDGYEFLRVDSMLR